MSEENKSIHQDVSVENTDVRTDQIDEKVSVEGDHGIGINKADIVSSVVLFALGIYVFISGVYMSFFAVSGAEVWYFAPGMLPMVIGFALVLLSVLLFRKKFAAGGRFSGKDVRKMLVYFKSKRFLRLLLAIALLAVYVFILLGRIPFVIATFLYLAVTMTVFRENKYAIWKILLVAVGVSVALYYGFGVLAGIPLP